jgi:hypothetical protein
MGMFDYIVVLDEILRCPHDHRVDEFQTKSVDDPAASRATSSVCRAPETISRLNSELKVCVCCTTRNRSLSRTRRSTRRAKKRGHDRAVADGDDA